MSECKIGPCGYHCNCYNDIDYDKPGCQWCQIITENETREKAWVEDRAKLSNALLQIRALNGRCLSEIDHANFCEEELKMKDQWCEMCRALDSIGVSQLPTEEKRKCVAGCMDWHFCNAPKLHEGGCHCKLGG